jgi:Protein of unknown function (DUF1573)
MMAHANQAVVSNVQAILRESDAKTAKRGVRSAFLQVAALTMLFGTMLVGFAWLKTGSLAHAWPWLHGQKLLFEPMRVELGGIERSKILDRSIRVTNPSSKPLSLLGAQRSCNCMTLEEFPLTIPAGKSHDLLLKVASGSGPGAFEYSIKFFTNAPGPPLIVIVSGEVE